MLDFEKVATALGKLQADNIDGLWYAIVHPKIYSGFWSVRRTIPALRWLGRKLHSRRVYWLGFQIEWVVGMKDW